MSDYSQLKAERDELVKEVERLKLLVPKVSPTSAYVAPQVEASVSRLGIWKVGCANHV